LGPVLAVVSTDLKPSRPQLARTKQARGGDPAAVDGGGWHEVV